MVVDQSSRMLQSTHLIKDEVLPLLALESMVVLNNELVRRDAHVECICFGPTLHRSRLQLTTLSAVKHQQTCTSDTTRLSHLRWHDWLVRSVFSKNRSHDMKQNWNKISFHFMRIQTTFYFTCQPLKPKRTCPLSLFRLEHLRQVCSVFELQQTFGVSVVFACPWKRVWD